jgi:hypothetical protein
MDIEKEYEDLENRITISAEVVLGSGTAEFEGLKTLEISVKKKEENTKIQNIEFRNKSKRNLF